MLERLGLRARELLSAAGDLFSGHEDAEKLVDTLNIQRAGRVSKVLEAVLLQDGSEHESDCKEKRSILV